MSARRAAAWAGAGVAVLVRPLLWPEAVRVCRALVSGRRGTCGPGGRTWLAFRAETAYGDPRAVPPARDVAAFLAWSRGEHEAGSGMRRRARRTR
ncbi:MAG: hypothetical protein M0Z33_08625 [Actinomycetota bacterium]|nr:hypothetical protein [Actinomycetota bacterium]